LERVAWAAGRLEPEAVTLQALALMAQGAGIDAYEWLNVEAAFETAEVAYASGCHAAVVAVDLATGGVRVLDYAVTHDCGRIANPLLVDGQIMGGVVQGLGAALFEALAYDAEGRPLSRGFGDYVLPSAATAPRFALRHLETPSPHNPLGMKGAGEAGCTGAAAAIVNALADALAPHGVTLRGCGPFSPARVLDLLHGAAPC
jgi:carbon-monoxide dehydrogenase large subunit